jgi:hypothetical protein
MLLSDLAYVVTSHSFISISLQTTGMSYGARTNVRRLGQVYQSVLQAVIIQNISLHHS